VTTAGAIQEQDGGGGSNILALVSTAGAIQGYYVGGIFPVSYG
jgi:hypothetical protein